MSLRFDDFLNDSPAAQAHRAQVAKAAAPSSAQDEIEALVAERIQANPRLTPG